ncbi:hypothetical protein FO519_000123 [Halicephalobus sp. NKZ332]|nr:hypothetical protein FO519_000123 [Halicephalobus sp. NKZ332]
MKTFFLFLGIFVAFSGALIRKFPKIQHDAEAEEYKSYVDYSVIRAIPHTVDQLNALVNVRNVFNHEFDFWRSPKVVGKAVDIMVSPEKRRDLTVYIKKNGMIPLLKIRDVGKLVAADRQVVSAYKRNVNLADDPDSFDFFNYHPFDEITSYIQAVANKYSSFVSISSMGKSLQGREYFMLKIGYPSTDGSQKNALFIDAGIHAREWIAPATALYTIGKLVTDSSYTDLLKAIDIYIAPSINPDGYEYSRNTDRMWRKSRSGPRQGCYGADINRNFPFKWMVSGASNNPCSETYAGPSALSEIEGKNLANFVNANNNTIKAYLTLHSYGEDILYPWGYTTGHYPPDVNDLKALGKEMYDAIAAVHGTKYVVGNSGDALYPAAGASDDYSKSVGVKYVYTVEVRPGDGDNDDDQWYGFELPPQFIQPTVEETLPALIAAAKRVQNVESSIHFGRQSISRELHELEQKKSFNFEAYHGYDEIFDYLVTLSNSSPGLLTYEIIGQTFQGRPIGVLKIGYPSEKEKTKVFIDGGIHAREWISPASVLWYTNELLQDPRYTHPQTGYLNKIDIYVLPVINADGYEYSRTTDRMWRKSRSGPRKGCYGVDLNRNFQFQWSTSGTSKNACDFQAYQGPKAASEPETQVLENFLKNGNFSCYLTVHSFLGAILYPYGYAVAEYPSDVEDLVKVGEKMTLAMKEATGVDYLLINSADLYPASGASDDYAKSIGIKYVFTIELFGSHGFKEPEAGIPLRGRELKAAFDTMIQELFNN